MTTDAGAAQPPAWWQRALIGCSPKRTLVRASILAVLCLIIFKYVVQVVRVEGESMLPTYKNHSIHLVYRLAYRWQEPKRGDVVAIRLLAGEHVMYLKRIIGLPGEAVAFHQGRLFINGNQVAEPYLTLPCYWEHESLQVGPDQYYVVGDNRAMPWDDHSQGRPARKLIVGKVVP